MYTGDNNGCYRDANVHGFIQPTMSARLRTAERFSFEFGRIEISARMPSGDWLWPGRVFLNILLSQHKFTVPTPGTHDGNLQ